MATNTPWQCRKTHLAKTIFTNITAKSPPLAYYPAAQRVTYLYYLGRFHFTNSHFSRAAQCLEQAYLQTPPVFMKHRRLILTYLVPAKMLLGYLPSRALLARPEAETLAPIFSQFALAFRTGNYLLFQSTLETHEKWLFRRGLLLTLTFRLRPLLWRSLSRRTFLLTYVAPQIEAGRPNQRAAATLDLAHLLVAATYIQKRLEGYTPIGEPTAPRPRPPHVNAIFMKAVSNQSTEQHGGSTTLVAPPGGPRKLRPNDGLVWGNMPVTAEHVEGVVASLVAQDLLHGYVAHSLGRFAIMGAAKKGISPVAAGWPPVADVLDGADAKGKEEVPGWVRS